MRLLADENFNGRILRALQRRHSELDIVRVQDTALHGATDPALLEWAAENGRVLLTHDIATLVGYAYRRVARGQPMAGVVAVRSDAGIGQALEDLVLLLRASEHDEFDGRILFVPL